MDRVVSIEAEPLGPEWFTSRQFEDRYGLSQAGANKRLRAMVRCGMVERWIGRVKGISPRTCKYRLTAKGKAA